MTKEPLDEELIGIMTHLFEMIRPLEKNLNDHELRCLIVASNLRGLAESILQVDDKQGTISLKRTALGLLGTADWLQGDLEPSSKQKMEFPDAT